MLILNLYLQKNALINNKMQPYYLILYLYCLFYECHHHKMEKIILNKDRRLFILVNMLL